MVTIASLNSKINSLFEKKQDINKEIENFDKEVFDVLSEVIKICDYVVTNDTEDREIVTKTCNTMKSTLENLGIVKNKNVMYEAPSKKCRYYNRGYCKFHDQCNFFHSSSICEQFQQEGMCRKKGCRERHPRNCRYWTKNPEGCKRNELCQYMHVPSKKYDQKYVQNEDSEVLLVDISDSTGSRNDIQNIVDDPYNFHCVECNIYFEMEGILRKHDSDIHKNVSTFSCSNCDFTINDSDSLNVHMRALHEHDEIRSSPEFILEIVNKTSEDINSQVSSEADSSTFPCTKCDFVTDRKYMLNTHNKSNIKMRCLYLVRYAYSKQKV